ncbi:MAG TPA: hypothetical protein EYQ69_06170, partial [Gemmatimonadetes bacterium]|nr:hypothetical protein [Gemmatimonadota bacterium]
MRGEEDPPDPPGPPDGDPHNVGIAGRQVPNPIPIIMAQADRAKQLKNVREASKSLGEHLKLDGGPFDGKEKIRVLMSIMTGEEILDNYRVADEGTDAVGFAWNNFADMTEADAVSVYFSNMTGVEKDYVRGQRHVKPDTFLNVGKFKDCLVSEFYNMITPFEGFAPLYDLRQSAKMTVKEFAAAPQSLITNARCLTEGVDVPA